jgi:hypothetical protein
MSTNTNIFTQHHPRLGDRNGGNWSDAITSVYRDLVLVCCNTGTNSVDANLLKYFREFVRADRSVEVLLAGETKIKRGEFFLLVSVEKIDAAQRWIKEVAAWSKNEDGDDLTGGSAADQKNCEFFTTEFELMSAAAGNFNTKNFTNCRFYHANRESFETSAPKEEPSTCLHKALFKILYTIYASAAVGSEPF